MTEPLFRFMLVRPPLEPDPAKPRIKLLQSTEFQDEIKSATGAPDPRAALNTAVDKYLKDQSRFLASEDATPFQRKLLHFSAELNKAERSGSLKIPAVVKASKEVLGDQPKKIIESEEFRKLVQRLKDSVVALKFAQSGPIEALSNQLRDCELLLFVASLDTTDVPEEGAGARGEPSTEIPPAQPTDVPTSQAWAPQTVYSLGSLVVFREVIYICIQAHTSLEGWQPDLTPALWVRGPREGAKPVPPSIPVPTLRPEDNLAALRQSSLEMPTEIDLPSLLARPASSEDGEDEDDQDLTENEAKKIIDDHHKMTAAVDELLKLKSTELEVTEQEKSEGISAPAGHDELTLQQDQHKFYSGLTAANLRMFASIATEGSNTREVVEPASSSSPAVGLAQTLLRQPVGITPLVGFDPALIPKMSMKLKDSVSLTEATTSTLKELNIDPSTDSLPNVVKDLRQRIGVNITDLRARVANVEQSAIVRIGNALVVKKTPISSRVTDLIHGLKPSITGRFLPRLPVDGRVPRTRGRFQSVGVADLLIVKQQLKGYEAADIAHIENVLKGESKSRDHTDLRRTEQTTFTEEELTNVEEHELGSTQRFEMAKESASTIKEDASLKAGLKATAKYGPVLEVSASVEGSLSRSREEVNKSASKYSQDVTQRTVKKITERMLQRQSFTTGTEVTEKNIHGIDNKAGSGNVSGVYQWVNKVYEAQVFNYGLRTMFDFMIPEPAAFLISAMTKAAEGAGADLEKPQPLAVTADKILVAGYEYLALKYGATDLTPPPEDFVTRVDQIAKTKGDEYTIHTHAGRIQIPKGYEAVYATASCSFSVWQDKAVIDIFIGAKAHRFGSSTSVVWRTALNHEEEEIAWGFNAWQVMACAVSVQIQCKASARSIEEWKFATHGKLYNAWKARELEYEEKLERLKLQQGVVIEGRNPTANLNTVKQELKKGCITIMTAQHFDDFNSIRNSQHGFPQINLHEAEAEGEYVRFFEQAFEWDQMTYVMYPYFWGSKDRWPQRIAFDDPDPVFDEFLKAGFARVVVPARPGFEGAIDHFQKLGEVWKGGPLPPISSKLYLAIADEIAERAKRPGDETPQGETWEVRVPTTLVKLRSDDKLPTWIKENGTWLPVAEA